MIPFLNQMPPTNPDKIRKQVDVWGDDYNWFEQKHHGASLTWIVSLLLKSYREVCTNPTEYLSPMREIVPEEIAKQAAREVKEMLDNS